MTDRRKFITLEGGEGTGKSTQARRLSARLVALGEVAVLTREPGGSPFAEALREAILRDGSDLPDPLAQALAFYAARRDHLTATILPALQNGGWVICDRFNDSTRVYQGAAGGVPNAVLAELQTLVVGDNGPGLTLVLDMPASDGLARAAARREADVPVSLRKQRGDEPASENVSGVGDMFEARDLAFHERLRDGFRQLATDEPDRCRLIDARGEADAIEAAIWIEVCRAYAIEA